MVGADVGVTIEGMAGRDVIFHDCSQVILTLVTEKECINRDTKFFPISVRGKEDCQAIMTLFEFVSKTSAEDRSLTGRELSGENLDEFEY